MVGVAVKVTGVPAQMDVPGLATIVAEVGFNGFTVMLIALLVAVEDVTQLNEEVKTQVTTSPFASVEELYVVLFVPTLEPFNFH